MDKEGWHHVIRNQRVQEQFQLIFRNDFTSIISCDIFVSAFFDHYNSSILHLIVLQKSSFDLTKFNTISSYLYLGVDSSDIFNISIALHADHITGSVKTFVLVTYGERIFHKYGSRLLRKIVISSCNLTSGMAKLTRSAYRKPFHIFVHNVAADIPL